MIAWFIKSVRRMSKTLGGCTKLWLMTISSFIILYTLYTMWIDKDPMSSVTWEAEDRSLSVEPNNMSLHTICDVTCQPDQYSFYIRSGEKSNKGPIICFQGEMYMSSELKNVNRGLNMVIVNYKTQVPHIVQSFDTYQSEVPLLRLLKKKVTNDDIILAATYDDASYSLKQAGRQWLARYGSKLIHKLQFRENFIMIGMRGLEQGKAIEYHEAKPKKTDFAPVIEKAGCFPVPLGKINNLESSQAKIFRGDAIKVGERFDNCGLPSACPADSVAVSISTGLTDKSHPRVCVDGFLRFAKGLNDAGRGINLITLNPDTLKIEATIHVDSYETDSTDIDFFLEVLPEGTILIMVIADEASTRMELSTRELLNSLGSGHIQNLRFRDLWYIVTQVGIKGFTQFEEIRYAPFSRDWPGPLLNKFCVPKKIPTSLTIPDPGMLRNDRRRDFCTKYEGYTEFCHTAHVDEELKTIDIYTKELKGHNVYETPVVLVPGMDHNAFVNTLQTTLLQPGIKQDLVSVFWDEKLPEYKELALMFGFREYILDSSTSYSEQLVKAMMKAKLAYPRAAHFIVLEEDLLLAPDFLPFMAACMDAMKKDDSIAGASAWNVNGFEKMSGKPSEVYRVKEFPGLGFMMNTTIVTALINSMGQCCKDRAWFGWQTEILKGKEMLIPALSRVYRMPMAGASGNTDLARELFLKPRQTHLEPHPIHVDIKHLQSENYEAFIKSQIRQATPIPSDIFDKCLEGVASPPTIPTTVKGAAVVFYQQNDAKDFKLLNKLSRCFGLVTLNKSPPKNMHNGLLRFYYEGHDVFLVGTSSPYYDGEIHQQVVMDPDYFKPGYLQQQQQQNKLQQNSKQPPQQQSH